MWRARKRMESKSRVEISRGIQTLWGNMDPPDYRLPWLLQSLEYPRARRWRIARLLPTASDQLFTCTTLAFYHLLTIGIYFRISTLCCVYRCHRAHGFFDKCHRALATLESARLNSKNFRPIHDLDPGKFLDFFFSEDGRKKRSSNKNVANLVTFYSFGKKWRTGRQWLLFYQLSMHIRVQWAAFWLSRFLMLSGVLFLYFFFKLKGNAGSETTWLTSNKYDNILQRENLQFSLSLSLARAPSLYLLFSSFLLCFFVQRWDKRVRKATVSVGLLNSFFKYKSDYIFWCML